jgi:translation initiation factor 1A
MKYKYDGENLRLPLPDKDENEMFAIVSRVLGGSRMSVQGADGKSRLARIPGRLRRRMGRIKMGDLLIISPWDIQDEKADIIYRYKRFQTRFLIRRNMLPSKIDLLV